MSLIPWQPLKELDTLRLQMNQIFDGLLRPDTGSQLMSQVWAPVVELKETETEIVPLLLLQGKQIKLEVAAFL